MLLNKQGVLIAEASLHKTYDLLERLESNVYVSYQALIFKELGICKPETQTYKFNLIE